MYLYLLFCLSDAVFNFKIIVHSLPTHQINKQFVPGLARAKKMQKPQQIIQANTEGKKTLMKHFVELRKKVK